MFAKHTCLLPYDLVMFSCHETGYQTFSGTNGIPRTHISLVQKRHEIRFYSILLLGDSRYWHIFQFTQSFYWEDCYYKDKMVTGSKIKTCLHSRYIENYGAGPSARNVMATKYRPCFLQNSDLDIGWFKYVKRHHSKRWRDSASADHKK